VLTTRLTALAAALAFAAPAPGEAATVARPEVLLVGGMFAARAQTAARTDPAVTYAITVTGTFTYNDKLSQQDCGHYDPPGALGWQGSSWPLLDGVPSPCTREVARASHTYCWTQRGTGDRLVFDMPDTATGDDVGGLVVVVDPLTATCAPAVG